MRYFLIDKILHIKCGESASAVKAITLTDPIMHDHFPDHPLMPGALIIEGMAQLAGLLLEASFNTSDENIVRAIMVQVDKMKFLATTGPGELLIYEAHIDSMMDDAARVIVTAHSNGEERAKGKISFQMAAINTENIKKQRQDLYRIWTKGLEDCPVLR